MGEIDDVYWSGTPGQGQGTGKPQSHRQTGTTYYCTIRMYDVLTKYLM